MTDKQEKLNFNLDFLDVEEFAISTNAKETKTTVNDNDSLSVQEKYTPEFTTKKYSKNSDYEQYLIDCISSSIDFSSIIGDGTCIVSFNITDDGEIENIEFCRTSDNTFLMNEIQEALFVTIIEELSPDYVNKQLNLNISLINRKYDLHFVNSDKNKIAKKKEQTNNISATVNHSVKFEEKSNGHAGLVIGFTIILFIVLGICYVSYVDEQNEQAISQIKHTAYAYLKNGDETSFNKEIKKVSQYKGNVDNIKYELLNKYEEEKQSAISDLAYNYENNKAKFYSLKQEYLPIFFNNDENQFNEEVEKKLGYKELSLIPEPLPASGLMHNYTNREAMAPFEIKTSDTTVNYYIKLEDSLTKEPEIIIFVRGGDSIKIDVPLGYYKIKYATGKTWFGEEMLFGHNTTYTTSRDILSFKVDGYYVKGHTLTLYKVANGNFATQSLTPEDF